MSAMCWEQNPNCIVKGQKQGESACIAYNENKGCWQIDWTFIVASLSDEEKARWKKIMKEQCPSCSVFNEHKDEMATMVRIVLSM